MGPKILCCQSQLYRRGELRAAAQPAINMKTVVGSPGTKIPTMPVIRLRTASKPSAQRTGAASVLLIKGGDSGMAAGAQELAAFFSDGSESEESGRFAER